MEWKFLSEFGDAFRPDESILDLVREDGFTDTSWRDEELPQFTKALGDGLLLAVQFRNPGVKQRYDTHRYEVAIRETGTPTSLHDFDEDGNPTGRRVFVLEGPGAEQFGVDFRILSSDSGPLAAAVARQIAELNGPDVRQHAQLTGTAGWPESLKTLMRRFSILGETQGGRELMADLLYAKMRIQAGRFDYGANRAGEYRVILEIPKPKNVITLYVGSDVEHLASILPYVLRVNDPDMV